jgi:hypothetical protein
MATGGAQNSYVVGVKRVAARQCGFLDQIAHKVRRDAGVGLDGKQELGVCHGWFS